MLPGISVPGTLLTDKDLPEEIKRSEISLEEIVLLSDKKTGAEHMSS